MQKPTLKIRLKEIIENQPEDVSYNEIMRVLEFEMIEHGLEDSNHNRTISNEEMGNRIKTW